MVDHNPDSVSHSKIKEWLDKQGYALEMRAALILEQAGFEVSQSVYYLDPEKSILREIDVTASMGKHFDNSWIAFKLFLECKYAVKPWVVFATQKRQIPYLYFARLFYGKYDLNQWKSYNTQQARFLASIMSSLGKETISKLNPFCLSANLGYRVTQSYSENEKDTAYSALMQISNCMQTHDITVEEEWIKIQKAYESNDRDHYISRDPSIFCEIGLPIILIRGKLFECTLNRHGEIDLKETADIVVSTSNKIPTENDRLGSTISMVRIITEQRLEPFAQEMTAAVKLLLSQEEAMRNALNHEYQQVPGPKYMDEIPF